MKKLGYFIMAVLLSLGMASCMDNQNEWEVDTTANGNRTWGPTGLSIGEKYGDYVKVYNFYAAQAKGYVFQASTVPFSEATPADIIEWQIGYYNSNDSLTLSGLTPNTSYYLRVKAQAPGKLDSEWLEYISDKGEYTFNSGKLAALTYVINMNAAVNDHNFTVPKYWHNGAITVVPTDEESKMTVDKNNKSYTDGSKFETRLKTGAKSSEKNDIKITTVAKGTLYIYVASGSGSDARDVALVSADGKQIAAITTPGTTGVTAFPVLSGKVGIGEYHLTYSGGIGIYAFQFEVDGGQTFIEEDVLSKYGPDYPEVKPEPETPFVVSFSDGTIKDYWQDGAMVLYCANPAGKMTMGTGTKTFGEKSFTNCIKTGTEAEGTSLTLSLAAPGTVYLYAISGNSSETRRITISTAATELFSQGLTTATTTYSVHLDKGQYTIGYPDKSISIYAIEFVVDAGQKWTPETPKPVGPVAGFTGEYNLNDLSSANATLTGGSWATTSFEGGEIPSASAAAATELRITLKEQPNIFVTYQNSSAKSNIFKCAANFLIIDGKGGVINVTGVKVGQKIKVKFAAKGSTAAILAATSGCTGSAVTSSTTSDIQDAEFTATDNTVMLKENNGGLRIYSISVTD